MTKMVWPTLMTGKELDIILPKFTDLMPVLQVDTGAHVLDGEGAPAYFRKYPSNEDGREEYAYEKKKLRDRIDRYNLAKKYCINLLKLSTDRQLMKTIELGGDKYINAYKENDILTIYKMAEYASTGRGASSIHVDMIKLVGLKPKDNYFEGFTSEYFELRRKIESSDVDKGAILMKFMDSLYVINCEITELEKVREEVMMENTWRTAEEYSTKWHTMIKAKRSMNPKLEKEKKEGAISANSAHMMKNMQKQLDDMQRLIVEGDNTQIMAYAARYKAKQTGGTMTCFRCGKTGHGWRVCTQEKTLCEKEGCNEYHATSQHDIISKLRRPRTMNIDTVTRKTFDNTSKPKMANTADICNDGYGVDEEDTMSRQLEDYELFVDEQDSFTIFNNVGSYGTKHSYNVTICKGGVPIDMDDEKVIRNTVTDRNVVTISDTKREDVDVIHSYSDEDEIVTGDDLEYHVIDEDMSHEVVGTNICPPCNIAIHGEGCKSDGTTVMTSVKVTKPIRTPPRIPTSSNA